MWSRGDSVLLRTVYAGRVRWAMPHRLVELTPERVVLHIAPGTRAGRPHRAYEEMFEQFRTLEWPGEEFTWERYHWLRLTEFGRSHSLNLFWDEAWSFGGWYVNLQEPLRESRFGFDTFDQALDVVVDPDRRWRWKDEDHLEELTRIGVFSEADAAAIRAEGDAVVARFDELLPTGWEDWRPAPEWELAELPADWAVL